MYRIIYDSCGVLGLDTRILGAHAGPRDGEYHHVSTLAPGHGAALMMPDLPDFVLPTDCTCR